MLFRSSYIGILEFIEFQQSVEHMRESIAGPGILYAKHLKPSEESPQVLIEPEYMPLINPHGLKKTISIKETPVKDRHPCLGFQNILTIQIKIHNSCILSKPGSFGKNRAEDELPGLPIKTHQLLERDTDTEFERI